MPDGVLLTLGKTLLIPNFCHAIDVIIIEFLAITNTHPLNATEKSGE